MKHSRALAALESLVIVTAKPGKPREFQALRGALIERVSHGGRLP
jgi:hypothetical protein